MTRMQDSPHKKIEVIARGLSVRDGRLLVCRNTLHGHCYLPGGHVDPGESSAHACEREYLEETGLVVRAGKCLLAAEVRFIQDGVARHEIDFLFHVEQSTGEPIPEHVSSRESEISFEWAPIDQLEDADFRPLAILGPVRSLLSKPPDDRLAGVMWISVQE